MILPEAQPDQILVIIDFSIVTITNSVILGSTAFKNRIVILTELIQDDLETEKFVVFACATYGEGDPPDNAKEFHEWMMSEERPSDMLKNTRFAVSNYNFWINLRVMMSHD